MKDYTVFINIERFKVQVRVPNHDEHHGGRTSHHEIDENSGTYRVATESGKIREVSWMERNERHLTQRTWKIGEPDDKEQS